MNRRRMLFWIFYCSQIIYIGISSHRVETQDQTSPQPNTLSDDADDIQKQLDNEARDRFNLHPNTIWIFNFPPKFPSFHAKKVTERYKRRIGLFKKHERKKKAPEISIPVRGLQPWTYEMQREWCKKYPSCGGKSQSPVSLPSKGLRHVKESRPLKFINFDTMPDSMVVENNGKTLFSGISVTLYGDWKENEWPMLRGGAANNRLYVFHSLTLHWPSEHVIEGACYPLETQALFRSADYKDYAASIKASSRDQLALLAVASLYEFSNYTQRGLEELMRTAHGRGVGNMSATAAPLRAFSPPLQQYVSYQGSLTAPPCSEAVLWLVRGRSLPVKRDFLRYIDVLKTNIEEMCWINRWPQPLNDRKLCYFS